MDTTRHAVRWFRRKILSRFEEEWSRWHITDDACFTLCKIPVQIVGGEGGPGLPEHDDDWATQADCRLCRRAAGLSI